MVAIEKWNGTTPISSPLIQTTNHNEVNNQRLWVIKTGIFSPVVPHPEAIQLTFDFVNTYKLLS